MSRRTPQSVLRLWQTIFAIAVAAVSLALVFWMVDAALGHHFLRHTADEGYFLLVNIPLFPNVVSAWLMLRFFSPRQSSRMDYYLLKWLGASCTCAFLTGGVMQIGPAVKYADFHQIISGGILLVIINLVLSLVILPILYMIFLKCRN